MGGLGIELDVQVMELDSDQGPDARVHVMPPHISLCIGSVVA